MKKNRTPNYQQLSTSYPHIRSLPYIAGVNISDIRKLLQGKIYHFLHKRQIVAEKQEGHKNEY